jgi:molybdopterin molybdotransferase
MRAFANRSDYPLISFEQAWETVKRNVGPLEPRRFDLSALPGLVLAEEIVAAVDIPPFAAATMDGYALLSADGDRPRRVLGEREAGDAAEISLLAGECLRIMTGAPLPAGADAVLPVEETREAEGVMIPRGAVRTGANVRRAGDDVAAGTRLLPADALLGPAEIGLLASVNRASALAYPRPRVAILATGSELAAPGSRLGPAQIPDSNSPALAAAVQLGGGEVVSARRVADREAELRAALLEASAGADLILTCGGVSMGTRDLVKPLLEALGTVHFGRVAIKPGKPLTYATVRGAQLFGLPGNPVSSLVMFEMFVRPVLRILAGHRAIFRPRVIATLRQRLRHEPDRLEFQRARLTREGERWYADTTGPQSSSRLLSLAGANALLCLPQGVGDFEAGASVEAIRLDRPEKEPAP